MKEFTERIKEYEDFMKTCSFQNYMKICCFRREYLGIPWKARDSSKLDVVILPENTNLWHRNIYHTGFNFHYELKRVIIPAYFDIIGQIVIHNPDNDLAYYYDFKEITRISEVIRAQEEYKRYEFSEKNATSSDMNKIKETIKLNNADYYKNKAKEINMTKIKDLLDS